MSKKMRGMNNIKVHENVIIFHNQYIRRKGGGSKGQGLQAAFSPVRHWPATMGFIDASFP